FGHGFTEFGEAGAVYGWGCGVYVRLVAEGGLGGEDLRLCGQTPRESKIANAQTSQVAGLRFNDHLDNFPRVARVSCAGVHQRWMQELNTEPQADCWKSTRLAVPIALA